MTEALLVEFTSESSGAYIFEVTDDLNVTFKDLHDKEYKLKVLRWHSNVLNGDQIDIELSYPDGKSAILESVWISEDTDETPV